MILDEFLSQFSLKEYAMADRASVDVAEFLGKQLETASPDLLRDMVRTFAEALRAPTRTTSVAPRGVSAATVG